MKINILIIISFCSILFACDKKSDETFIFFLHNRFLETHKLDELHPKFGRVEYKEIITKFESNGFKVISEKRNRNVNTREYAIKVVKEIKELIKKGINPRKITIVGTSKGGYIAQYVSTFANNQYLNFVFIGSFRNTDINRIPEINFCGNILTIYEKTDPLGTSAIERKKFSTCNIQHFKEIELNTGLRHGFLFKPLKEWMVPTMKWANGNYDLK